MFLNILREMSDIKSAGKGKSTIKEKSWGSETSWSAVRGICGKHLHIMSGRKTSLKYYKVKDEVFYLQKGEVEVLCGDQMTLHDSVEHPFQKILMIPGDYLIVQSECPYQIYAVKDSEILEIGNNFLDVPVEVKI